MNVLVLGGTGFIGKHLCKRLIKEGHVVRVISNLNMSPQYYAEFCSEYIVDNFNTNMEFDLYLKNIDIVYHLISTTIPSSFDSNKLSDMEDNVIPTIKLLEAATKARVSKVIFTSSGGTIYGNPEYIPIDELHPTNPISSYGIQKLTIEKYLQLFNRLYGLDFTSLRISNPYGLGQDLRKPQGVVGVFIDHIKNGQIIEVWGSGEATRDYIYIEDVIEAMVLAIAPTRNNNILNIGTGKGTTLNEVIRVIGEGMNIPFEVSYKVNRSVDVDTNILSIKRACEELGWLPKYSFTEGINKMILQMLGN